MKHEMNILDSTGHTKNIWDPAVEAEVDAAREMFDSLTEQGYRAFHVGEEGKEGRRMQEFDPEAGKMILVPQLKGG